MAIKEASPFEHTFVITHCNGAAGYLPTRDAYIEGGYEVKSRPFAPPVAEKVVKKAVESCMISISKVVEIVHS